MDPHSVFRRRLGWASKLLLARMCIATASRSLQDNVNATGPESCPNAAGEVGYSDLSTLMEDMLIQAIDEGLEGVGPGEGERVFSLCPNTEFDMGGDDKQTAPFIAPLLPETVIRCGNGELENMCTLKGGYNHVLFDDDLHNLKKVVFEGLRFEGSHLVSVAALGHPAADVTFKNCEWKNNGGFYLVQAAWEKDMDLFLEPPGGRRELSKMHRRYRSFKQKIHRAGLPKHGRKLQQMGEGAMALEFIGCNFVNNHVQLAGIANAGGTLDLNDCSFQDNNAGIATVISIDSSTLSLQSGTSFYSNTAALGPVFVDSSSFLINHTDTRGGENEGGECQGIFLEEEGHSCLKFGSCSGMCCLFGDNNCDEKTQGSENAIAGPQQCTGDAATVGYSDLATLLNDMVIHTNVEQMGIIDKREGTREFTLCPNTDFDLGSALGEDDEQTVPFIAPLLPETVIRCGNDGKLENRCTLKGGFHHVYFDDDLPDLKDVVFEGLTFEGSHDTSVVAIGHPAADVKFVNCEWKNNAGNFLVAAAWEKNIDSVWEPHQTRERRELTSWQLAHHSLKHKTNRADMIKHFVAEQASGRKTQEMGEGAMQLEFIGCNFVGNNVRFAGIDNEGGSLDLNNCTFRENKAGIATVASIKKSKLSLHSGTSFNSNTASFAQVFVDSSSALSHHKDTKGGENQGSKKECQGIFLEKKENDCLQPNSDSCDGVCCQFGDNDCTTEDVMEELMKVPPFPSTRSSSPPSDSNAGSCGTVCISLLVVFSVSIVCVTFLLYTRMRMRGGQGQVGATMDQGHGDVDGIGDGFEMETPKKQDDNEQQIV